MNMICLNCPKGCLLAVSIRDGMVETTGQKCPKGLEFAERECLNPVRMLTTTVKTNDAHHRRVPVRTTAAIPKDRILEAMAALDTIVVTLPITIGTVIVRNFLNLGTDIIATFTLQTFNDGGHR